MMMPVGRSTMVRTFARPELVRAMSFVVVCLIGPMLGPVAGIPIVGYFHWRVYFSSSTFRLGLLGLHMVYRHLPDYREKESRPLDFIGPSFSAAASPFSRMC